MKAYIVNVKFENLDSNVWRRVIMPAGGTFHRLHETIQYVTNFQSRLEQYYPIEIELEDIFITNDGDIIERYNGKKYKGKKLRQPTGTKFDRYLENEKEIIYQYNNWIIRVTLEEIVDDYYFGYPTLLNGVGEAPPDHIEGPNEYKEFLHIYENPKDPNYLSMHKWAQENYYYPFDDYEINEWLKYVKYKKTEWDQIKHENYFVLEDPYRGEQVNITDLSNKELIMDYARACTNLYGIISFRDFLKIYNLQNIPRLTGKELRAYVKNYKSQLDKNLIYIYNNQFVHEALMLFKGNLEFILAQTKGKPFYVPSKAEMLCYKEDGYYEVTKHLELLGKKLAKDFFAGRSHEVEDILDDLVGEIQVIEVGYNNIIKEFINRFKFKDMNHVNEYLELVTNVINSTRRWENRGHKPVEISSRKEEKINPQKLTVINGDKIGRNDPCSCGSGKKYKKCCGK